MGSEKYFLKKFIIIMFYYLFDILQGQPILELTKYISTDGSFKKQQLNFEIVDESTKICWFLCMQLKPKPKPWQYYV